MNSAKPQNLPEIFRPEDSQWASRAAKRGEIRRLARGLYSTNLDEPAEQLLRRRWYDVAALYFPGAVLVDRSAVLAAPAADGSLFLDVGRRPVSSRPILLPGLTLRPRKGTGQLPGDGELMSLHIAGQARTALENLVPSRARSGEPRTLRRAELEAWLERIAQTRGVAALNELRDSARELAPTLGLQQRFVELDRLLGALQGTRSAGLAYDTDRLLLFELLRGELASQTFAERPAPADPQRLFAFFEAYFSNWIEGTIFEVSEAEEIVFAGLIPAQRPADAHDVLGTFAAVTDHALRSVPPRNADELEQYLLLGHRRIMAERPEAAPGQYKERPNQAGMTLFVQPELVRGTLREGFRLLDTLPQGFARAIFAMFLVAEVHPFADGNGRVARLLMNAELSVVDQARVMVPLSYRDEYMSALRALTHNRNPVALWRMIDRAQRWAAEMTWTDHARLFELMAQTNALITPEAASLGNIHLLDPAD